MGRQTKPSGKASASSDDGNYNIVYMGKKTKELLSQKAGNPEFANLSMRGRSLYRTAEEHYSPEAVNELLKELLLRAEFSDKGSVNNYTIETIPLSKRSELKEELWKKETNDGIPGKWSAYLTDLKLKFDKSYWDRTKQYIYDRSMDDFDKRSGLLGHLAVYNPKVEVIEANQSNPEFVRLIELHDNDPLTPVISGKSGAGKSNFVLHTFRMSAMHNKGFINPKYGNRSRLRAYLPNFDGAEDRGLKSGVFPGIHSSFSYRFPWQMFVDSPKGGSILWTKYDWAMAQEEELDDSADIFSMVYLGEIGMGKMRYAGSREVTLYRNLFQLTRQMRIRYYASSADPEPMPVSMMEDFVQPQIWIDITQSGNRIAKAEYLEKNQIGTPTTVNKKLGSIPLDPMTKIIGRGIASDMTGAWESFPLQQFLEFSRATNMKIYLNNPDTVMENASNFVLNFQDNYIEQVYPDEVERIEKEDIQPESTYPSNDKADEEDDDGDDGRRSLI